MSGQRKSHRRDFLRGRAAADAVADLAQNAATSGESLENPVDQPYVVQVKRRAMACDFAIFLKAGQYPHATESAIEALDLVEQLESQLSVFRPESELCRINLLAADAATPVEPRLFALLAQALQVSAQTKGAYDITSGPLSKVWGFYRRAGEIPQPANLAEALQRVGYARVQLDPAQRTIRFLTPGVELNLGSIGKGYALDRCAEHLESAGIAEFLLHGGKSSVLARGSRATGPEGPRGWTIGLPDPLHPGRRLAELRLQDKALATSGSAVQFFRYRGRRYGHILDPRTGWPAEGVLSATVIAPTAAAADALSTAFYVIGAAEAMEYCHTHPEIAAVLLRPAPHGNSVEVHAAGLAEETLRMLA
ncbi:MAG: FAD:protein FMN transferase [Pirellulales bacterium]